MFSAVAPAVPVEGGLLCGDIPGKPESHSGEFSAPCNSAGGSCGTDDDDWRVFNHSGESSTPAGSDKVSGAEAACAPGGGDWRFFNQSGESSLPVDSGEVSNAEAPCAPGG